MGNGGGGDDAIPVDEVTFFFVSDWQGAVGTKFTTWGRVRVYTSDAETTIIKGGESLRCRHPRKRKGENR